MGDDGAAVRCAGGEVDSVWRAGGQKKGVLYQKVLGIHLGVGDEERENNSLLGPAKGVESHTCFKSLCQCIINVAYTSQSFFSRSDII